MLFTSASFLVFIAIVFPVYALVLRRQRVRVWFLTIASCFFYACWDWRFLGLLIGTGLCDFYIALGIGSPKLQHRRKQLLALSVTLNLLVLCVFKYLAFFLTSTRALTDALHIHVPQRLLELGLPVGISFYTFQAISYTVDTYRGKFAPRTHFVEYLASLTYFPHLVAGPIVRAATIIPQFEQPRSRSDGEIRYAFVLICGGLFKKTVADVLAPIVGKGFDGHPQSGLQQWTALIAFAAQIYGDFSGYTDIAIGISALLGIDLPDNFNLPYLSTSIVEFWRRWHISLSSWLRDYLYIPLGGKHARMRNLFITMLLGGLWHGANWTFMVWGGYHGLLLAAAHALDDRFGKRFSGRGAKLVAMLFTFYCVELGWLLFRAESLGQAYAMFLNLHSATVVSAVSLRVLPELCLVVVLGLVLPHALDFLRTSRRAWVTSGWRFWALCALCASLFLTLDEDGHGFMYFQF